MPKSNTLPLNCEHKEHPTRCPCLQFIQKKKKKEEIPGEQDELVTYMDSLIKSPARERFSVTVKLIISEDNILTKAYRCDAFVYEIRKDIASLCKLNEESIKLSKDDKELGDKEQLFNFGIQPNGIIEFKLVNLDAKQKIKKVPHLVEPVPDVITVRVEVSPDEYKDIIVEIHNSPIEKPYLGGFRHKETGCEYHHGYSQTGPAPPQIPLEFKSSRDTQTYWLRNRRCEQTYSRATQMSNPDVYIPNITDRIVSYSGHYETADEWERRRDVLNKVRTIQRYWRAYKIRMGLHALHEEYWRRIRDREEEERQLLEDDKERKRVDIIRKVFPRTREDFAMLYAMIDRWKKSEIERISKITTKAPKIAEFYILLQKEVELLQAIDRQRYMANQDREKQKIIDFLKEISTPLEWHGYNNLLISMDTYETQRGREFRDLYYKISDHDLSVEERMNCILNLKFFLKDHNCVLANEIVELLERESDLLVRGLNDNELDVLHMRIEQLLLQHIKAPECNDGVTKRITRLKEKSMETDLFYCTRCEKLKSHAEFPINSRTTKFNECLSCMWSDRVAEPWIEITPYQYILRSIQREERRRGCHTSISYILQDKDIYHLIQNIWHGHSLISEETNVYNLRLGRWKNDEEWSPWNCVLLTVEELKLHDKVKHLREVYDDDILTMVKTRHLSAKKHFSAAINLRNNLEKDGKWDSIKDIKKFIAVNSKVKMFLNCH